MNQSTFDEQFVRFEQMSRADGRFTPKREDFFPCFEDDVKETPIDPHYHFHVNWAARKLAELNPVEHHDFGSFLHFSSICSAFVPTTFYDIRPLKVVTPGLKMRAADLTALPIEDGSLFSMSCLHVIEHAGLGRYGDKLDAQGDKKAAKELARVLMPGGQLLIVAPLEDPPRICFHAHRLYNPQQVEDLFPTLAVEEFTLITNESEIFDKVNYDMAKGRIYACGCWVLSKP